MNNHQPNFIYFSSILNIPVVDYQTKRKFGFVYDVVADLREMYPRVSALVVKKKFSKKVMYLPWNSVKAIEEKKYISTEKPDSAFIDDIRLSENEICLKETFLDKQIVDISGSKVVRVNDLHILCENLKLWFVHVDIGFKGLLRRLGWLKFFSFMSRWLFSYEMKEKFISWKYVQPITSTEKFKYLSLKVPHSKLAELHPADLADILIDLGMEERLLIFGSFDMETAADILQELPTKIRVQVAEMLDRGKLAQILEKMPMDEVVDLLDEMRNESVDSLFKILPAEDVKKIKDLRKHSEHTAGSLMNPEFISADLNASVREVMKLVREEAEDMESIYYIYIIDEKKTLNGIVTLKQLLIEEHDTKMSELMRQNVIKVEVDTHIKKVAQVFFKYNFMVVPVVDEENRIAGIITIKDALESVFPEIREETEETT